MFVSHIKLKNWKNFQDTETDMTRRVFLVGPNASGKSNFLDVFRFLRDVAKQRGGGLQGAVEDRGGLGKIRCLAARSKPNIEIEVTIKSNDTDTWVYSLGLSEQSGKKAAIVTYERVIRNSETIFERPNESDKKDKQLLTQTYLEQIQTNSEFRDIVVFFDSIHYYHLVPQMLRYPDVFSGSPMEGEPYGRDFLERVATTKKNILNSRLKRIEEVLTEVVPQLQELQLARDAGGKPHLEAKYRHWRPQGAKQQEDQFSDGTLRLIALLWTLMEGKGLLLMEEPELSLHSEVVGHFPAMLHNVLSKSKRKHRSQILLSTHEYEMFYDQGIGQNEVLVLSPSNEGTKIVPVSSYTEIQKLIESGLPIPEAIKPHIRPAVVKQLTLY